VRKSLTFLVLLAFIGFLFYALFVPRIGRHHEAPITKAQTDVNGGIKTALEAFKVDTGHYPKGTNGLLELVQQPSGTTNWHGPYFDPPEWPVDPWGHKYIYENPGKHNTNLYDLFSAGPDGKAGTDDDIGNWMN
jgi:general secretion pathway protein G